MQAMGQMTAPAKTAAARLRHVLGSPWLHPLNDTVAIDELLQQVNPLWSLAEARARVVAIRDETADTRSFVLRPNAHWRGFSAGQHVLVRVEIDGVRCQRAYSLSSSPRAGGALTITVKRQPGGRVSNSLHDTLEVGAVIALSPASGAFTLPDPVPPKLLLLAAGSGITPVMSMLRELAARGHDGDVHLVYSVRTRADVIFADELDALAHELPGLRIHTHRTAERGRLDAAALLGLAPDLDQREIFLCGPDGFMAMVQDLCASRGLGARLHCERFGAPVRRAAGAQARVEIRAARSERLFTASTGRALLTEAEAAGLTPAYGCRIGICQSCRCRKTSGTVENLLTGKTSSEPGETIQLCVSAARSDLVLDL